MSTERFANVAVLLQILLLMGMTFSNIYFIDVSDGVSKTETAVRAVSAIFSFFNIIPSVSALEATDIQNGVATCIRTKQGASCQEFPASECAAQCNGACIPSSRNNVQECKLGTCYSSSQGSCQIGAPKTTCEQSGGQWFDTPNGNIPQCRKGCCVLGQQSAFVTSQECTTMSSRLGTAKIFKPEINNELACLALSGGDKEGACIIESGGEDTCRFNTRTQCTQLRGDFHEGYLCSATQLRTNCIKQSTARCVEGKDEIYWFDSCGNKENIYSANKDQSWNNGQILPKSQSCSLASGSNLEANKATCGNCNYLLGTRCGAKTQTQKLADNSINFVCRDLGCVDDKGKERKNGESWCTYQSSIGVDQGRSTDAVGSRHFRQLCVNGNIQTEPCADFRNGLCVESTNTQVPGGFSSAACRLNTWQQCINYNVVNETARCAQNPDCFLNNVYVGPTYNFTVCTPKYAPGFDLTTRAQSAEMTCSIANQKCKVVYVKELAGLTTKWRCKQNCECETAAYTQKLNNLCMSLGDCGAKVNIAGKVVENYRITNAPKLDSSYLNGISRYAAPVPGKVVDAGNLTQLAQSGALGLPLSIDGQVQDPNEAAITMGLYTAGALGITLAALAYGAPAIASLIGTQGVAFAAGAGHLLGGVGAGGYSLTTVAGTLSQTLGTTSTVTFAGGSVEVSSAALAAFDITGQGAAVSVTSASGASGTAAGQGAVAVSSNPGFAAFGGAAAGAAIGLAVVSILLKATGVGRGLSPGVAYSLMAAGAIGGAMIGYATFAATAAWVPVVGWILAGAAVLFTGVLKLVGVGDTKEVIVEFQCQPWQAPTGGADCSKCGQNGLSCSKYSCQSLGQTCQLLNEGTERQLCVDVSPQDSSAPIIGPWNDALLPGFTYTGITAEGYKVKPTNQDCVPAYTQMQIGISLNEPAQCKFDYTHTSSYRDMNFSFGYRNFYLQNHSMNISIPSLESLGVYNLGEAQTDASGNFDLYVRCQDRNGNANIREYNVNFCVSRGNDVVPPIVVRSSPPTDEVALSATQEDIRIFVNEPATCKISNYDMLYSNMTTFMTCFSNVTDQSAYGFACNATVQLQQNLSSFFVRCADQPWLNETDYAQGRNNNVNGQSLAFNLRKTARALRIDSLEPDNRTVTSSVYPGTAEIIARTSGGVDNGKSICSINISNNWVQFLESDSTVHKQTFNQLSAGNKSVQVRCVDRVGNSAEKSSNFSIVIDNGIPAITRVYAEANSLIVVTDENSECRYSNRRCEFDFAEGSAMSGIDKVHSSPLDRNKDYFVACKDRLGNQPGRCQITVREGRLE